MLVVVVVVLLLLLPLVTEAFAVTTASIHGDGWKKGLRRRKTWTFSYTRHKLSMYCIEIYVYIYFFVTIGDDDCKCCNERFYQD